MKLSGMSRRKKLASEATMKGNTSYTYFNGILMIKPIKQSTEKRPVRPSSPEAWLLQVLVCARRIVQLRDLKFALVLGKVLDNGGSRPSVCRSCLFKRRNVAGCLKSELLQ